MRVEEGLVFRSAWLPSNKKILTTKFLIQMESWNPEHSIANYELRGIGPLSLHSSSIQHYPNPELGALAETTPEAWPELGALAETTPEAWPELGALAETTPEAWLELVSVSEPRTSNVEPRTRERRRAQRTVNGKRIKPRTFEPRT
jgi:hypothetical protein